MPSFQAFLLPVGMIHLIYGLVLFVIFPLPDGVDIWPLLAAIAAGLFRTASVTTMLYLMRREEVSRIIPVVYTYPIFVAIMATVLLGETLSYLGWLAIIIVVTGAVMVSAKQGTSFWNIFSIGVFCLSGAFLLISMRPRIIRQLGNMEKRNSVFGLLAFNETLAPVGIVLMLWALGRGPVSLVSTIIGSRPIFVVIFALIMSRISPMFLEWTPGKGMLALRLIATAMIVGGIAIIYLM
jgi:uncharacterized membrane protein